MKHLGLSWLARAFSVKCLWRERSPSPSVCSDPWQKSQVLLSNSASRSDEEMSELRPILALQTSGWGRGEWAASSSHPSGWQSLRWIPTHRLGQEGCGVTLADQIGMSPPQLDRRASGHRPACPEPGDPSWVGHQGRMGPSQSRGRETERWRSPWTDQMENLLQGRRVGHG